MIPDMMTAIDPAGPGGPEVLQPVQRPVPQPGPGEQRGETGVAEGDEARLLVVGGAEAVGLTQRGTRGEGDQGAEVVAVPEGRGLLVRDRHVRGGAHALRLPAARRRAASARAYCTGLLLPGERKSVEPMAARIEPDRVQAKHQSMHHVVAKAEWDDAALLRAVRDWWMAGGCVADRAACRAELARLVAG